MTFVYKISSWHCFSAGDVLSLEREEQLLWIKISLFLKWCTCIGDVIYSGIQKKRLWVYVKVHHGFMLWTCIFTMWDKVYCYAHFIRDLLFRYGKFNQMGGKDLSWFNIKNNPEHKAMNYLYDFIFFQNIINDNLLFLREEPKTTLSLDYVDMFWFCLNGKNYLLSLYSFKPHSCPHLNLLIYSPFTNS